MEKICAVVLAAGRGTRMKAGPPKVLEALAGRPLLVHVLEAVRGAGVSSVCVVVGHGGNEVAGCASAWGKRRRLAVRISKQKKPLGSGDAAAAARGGLGGARTLLVLAGDAPLVSAAALRELLAAHAGRQADATLLAAELREPSGYGRVIRTPQGTVSRVVEEADATEEQRKIRRVNTGAYAFRAEALFRALPKLKADNAKREYYLTDVVAILSSMGGLVAESLAADADDARGVNDPAQLAEAGAILRRRILLRHMQGGVRVEDPATTYVDAEVRLGSGVRLRPGTHLLGTTTVAADCDLGPDTFVEDSSIGARSRVFYSVVRSAKVGADVWVGPYAQLRPGAEIGDRSKIGNFVEVKMSRLGTDVSAGHLAYLGDATLGDGVNIGAGTITANFDGVAKHATVIGAGSKSGSNTVFVAPLRIGRNVVTGAGAVVKAGTKVPDGSLLVGVPARVLSREAGKPKKR